MDETFVDLQDFPSLIGNGLRGIMYLATGMKLFMDLRRNIKF